MPQGPDDEKDVMTPQKAADAVQPGLRIASGDDDPREEEGWSQPESSAQKLPEPPGADRR
ncbi:hypothetical protein [Anaeromyxobacter oryzae]|uniref:Uncharacterized protein n=1 Tax=Anaeromyxobacter oryzae TaxID=2918170 RepID=A0ABM7WYG0_9BACT|nr:hypothetical protein [Anaeromyxobacter oryzae]BDG04570.1 hypothetical protein AMOR_35660 [Anaeromyxobacter oryzae]